MFKRTLNTAVLIVGLVIFFGAGFLVLSTTYPRNSTAALGLSATAVVKVTSLPPTDAATAYPTELALQAQLSRLSVREQATAYTISCAQAAPETAFTPEVCSMLKIAVLELEAEQFSQTATAAVPTIDPLRSPTPITPLPTATAYILTDADRVIKRVPKTVPAPEDPISLWRLGRVVGAYGEFYTLKLWSDVLERDGERTTVIGLDYTINPGATGERDPAIQNKRWFAPENLGKIEIVAVSDQRGIVSWVAEDGRTGTFNLATEEWQIGSTVVQQTPRPSSSP